MKVKLWCGKGFHWWGLDVVMETETLPCEPPAELMAVNTEDWRNCPEHDPERPRAEVQPFIEKTFQVVITGYKGFDWQAALTHQVQDLLYPEETVSVGHLMTREVSR